MGRRVHSCRIRFGHRYGDQFRWHHGQRDNALSGQQLRRASLSGMAKGPEGFHLNRGLLAMKKKALIPVLGAMTLVVVVAGIASHLSTEETLEHESFPDFPFVDKLECTPRERVECDALEATDGGIIVYRRIR